jgi:hypothetical protein
MTSADRRETVRRLRAVERNARWWRSVLLALLGCCAIPTVVTRALSSTTRTATSLTVVDAGKSKRLVLEATPSGPRLRLVDARGIVRAELAVTKDSGASLAFAGAPPSEPLRIDVAPNGYSRVQIRDSAGVIRSRLVTSYGSASLELFDRVGTSRAELTNDDRLDPLSWDSYLALKDSKGNWAASLRTFKSGESKEHLPREAAGTTASEARDFSAIVFATPRDASHVTVSEENVQSYLDVALGPGKLQGLMQVYDERLRIALFDSVGQCVYDNR